MIKKVVPLILTFFLLTSFHFGNPGNPDGPGDQLDRILQKYHKADDLFHVPDSTPANDSVALTGFDEVIAALEKAPDFSGKDTLFFQSYLKQGILLDVRSDFAGSKNSYCSALRFHPQKDSLLFVTDIYAGASYYNLNIFDSASYFLQQAESLPARFQNSNDGVRLYNTLGVLYYDNGNYQQGKSYFTRALDILNSKKPLDTAIAVNIQTNIATAYYRLGLFQESLAIYKKILAYRIFPDLIYMNMGMAYASLEQYKEALFSFRKVNDTKIPSVLNEMADVQRQLHRPDSSAWLLDKLQAPGRTGQVNELDLGINDMLRADLLADQQQYMAALTSLQKAIVVFSRDREKKDLFSNPSNFTGTFACYRLFDALFKKSTIFEKLFRSHPRDEYLMASYEAYKAALSLLRYIERSYDTDDAKIFLKKKNTEFYRGAFSVCLELYHRHPGSDYLQQAFLISEKSKASIISANLKERTFNTIPGVEEALLQKERNIKYNIARLNVKSEGAADDKEITSIASEKAGYEIGLSRVQKELEQNGNYYKLKYDDSSPGVGEIQQALGKNQVLVSFTANGDVLHVFALTRSGFSYTRVDSSATLQKDVDAWLGLLKTAENGRRFKGDAIGARLYQRLIRPIRQLAPEKDEWIIVPDGFLYFLPFESLPADAMGKTLLQTTTISYQFSSRLLLTPVTAAPSPNPTATDRPPGQVLAFAPFAAQGGKFGDGPANSSSQLPASGEEIAGLQGPAYIDSMATKDRFLQTINRYPIVHLATHAVSSINNAAASFIAFYPVKHSRTEDCLFLEELYGLNLNATKLVIISACETGQGELVSNEGVISLARAFAYAGCESTVNSLWKADDQATSFILRKFHDYLQNGYTKSKALRQAKLDYLESDAINKSPAYWAHLILIGNTEPLYSNGNVFKWILTACALLVLSFVGWIASRKKKKNKS